MADRESPGRDDQPTRRRLDDPAWVDDIVSGAVQRAHTPAGTVSPPEVVRKKVVRKKVVKPPVVRRQSNNEPTMDRAPAPGPLMTATSLSSSLPRLDDDGGDDGEADRDDPPHRARRAAIEWTVVIVGSLLVAILIKTFLFQAFYIPSASMEGTLQVGDRVLVNKVSYDLGDVNRGDLVVFKRPSGAAAPANETDDLIKRVVALPGESVEVRSGAVYINGLALDEPYLADDLVYPDFGPVTIPDRQVFVMGDNRPDSRDSRVFGPIASDQIVGRAFFRLWPPSSVGFL